MSDYAPDYMDAQSYYVLGRATRRRNLTGQQAIDITPYSVEFDRFIRKVKSEAWDEALEAAEDAPELWPGGPLADPKNPYTSQEGEK